MFLRVPYFITLKLFNIMNIVELLETIDSKSKFNRKPDNKIVSPNSIVSIGTGEELEPILLTEDILLNKFDFHVNGIDGSLCKIIYPAKFGNVVDGSNIPQRQMIKPPGYLIIKIDDGNGRFTTYLYHDQNKIYINEHSYVHELQLTIFVLTGNFPTIKM